MFGECITVLTYEEVGVGGGGGGGVKRLSVFISLFYSIALHHCQSSSLSASTESESKRMFLITRKSKFKA